MAIEPIEQFAFNPATGWNDSTRFPTYEDDEEQVRADLQALHDQTRDYINSLRTYLEAFANDVAASAVAGDIPDGTISTAKLAGNAVSTAKIQPGAVTTEKLAADAVTAEKIADEAVGIDKVDFVVAEMNGEANKVPTVSAVAAGLNGLFYNGGAAKIKQGVYIGDGTYGADNKTSLTFPFVPLLLIVADIGHDRAGLRPGNTSGFWWGSFIWTPNTSYSQTLYYDPAAGNWSQTSFPFSQPGTTLKNVAWYSTYDAASQFNELGNQYEYIAIGF